MNALDSSSWRVLAAALAVGAGAAGIEAGAAFAASPSPTPSPITEFKIPTPQSDPEGITVGPDHNLWFAELYGDAIARVTPSGDIAEHRLAPGADPASVATGWNGDIWFAELDGNAIGVMTPTGHVTHTYPVPTQGAYPTNIVAGPDHSMWFTEQFPGTIAKITMSGRITEYRMPDPQDIPQQMVTAPDGRLWFTVDGADGVGKLATINAAGQITEYPGAGTNPSYITVARDGDLWFAAESHIGQATTAGRITLHDTWPVPSNNWAAGITTERNGDIAYTYYDDVGSGGAAEMTPQGRWIAAYPTPTPKSMPGQLVNGPDGALWFTESYANKIARAAIV